MKVALGVAIAKGVSVLTKGSAQASPGQSRQTPVPRETQKATTGGLQDMMGDLLGGSRRSTRSTRTDGGGDLLEEITGQKRTKTRSNAPKGGLDSILGGFTGGGKTPAGGGLGDLLGSVLGGGLAARPGPMPVEDEDEISAALMLRAIIQAVKCDGALDEDEKARLMQAMGDATPAEVQAVNAELTRPVDIDGLARMVPNGMEAQVYLASLTAINLDSQPEAQYLHNLAQALELTPTEVNALHDRAGVAHIYR
ncbi:MAG: DUF533 domain-containing protein [Paracoccaceae bacterium]